MKAVILILLIIFAGCSPVEPEPITEIRIEPDYAEIELGESIELFCFDQLDRAVTASWSKHCGAGTLSIDIGESCIYTAPKSMTGIQEIYAEYRNLRAVSDIKGI